MSDHTIISPFYGDDGPWLRMFSCCNNEYNANDAPSAEESQASTCSGESFVGDETLTVEASETLETIEEEGEEEEHEPPYEYVLRDLEEEERDEDDTDDSDDDDDDDDDDSEEEDGTLDDEEFSTDSTISTSSLLFTSSKMYQGRVEDILKVTEDDQNFEETLRAFETFFTQDSMIEIEAREDIDAVAPDVQPSFSSVVVSVYGKGGEKSISVVDRIHAVVQEPSTDTQSIEAIVKTKGLFDLDSGEPYAPSFDYIESMTRNKLMIMRARMKSRLMNDAAKTNPKPSVQGTVVDNEAKEGTRDVETEVVNNRTGKKHLNILGFGKMKPKFGSRFGFRLQKVQEQDLATIPVTSIKVVTDPSENETRRVKNENNRSPKANTRPPKIPKRKEVNSDSTKNEVSTSSPGGVSSLSQSDTVRNSVGSSMATKKVQNSTNNETSSSKGSSRKSTSGKTLSLNGSDHSPVGTPRSKPREPIFVKKVKDDSPNSLDETLFMSQFLPLESLGSR